RIRLAAPMSRWTVAETPLILLGAAQVKTCHLREPQAKHYDVRLEPESLSSSRTLEHSELQSEADRNPPRARRVGAVLGIGWREEHEVVGRETGHGRPPVGVIEEVRELDPYLRMGMADLEGPEYRQIQIPHRRPAEQVATAIPKAVHGE